MSIPPPTSSSSITAVTGATRRSTARVGLQLGVTLLLAACNSDGEPESMGTSSATLTTTSPPTATGIDSDGSTSGTTTSGTSVDSTTGEQKFDVGVGTETSGMLGCSSDLHEVLDESGEVVMICPPDQGCADGVCVPACEAAANAFGSVGCDFKLATPGTFSQVLPPCHALFVANGWNDDVELTLSRDGVEFDVAQYARIPQVGVAPEMWAPIPANGIPQDGVAVVFLSSDPNSIQPLPMEDIDLSCPITPAVDASTAISGSGRGPTFELQTSRPVTTYDILPFGGARSHFPSAQLLYPSSAWGDNYVVLGTPVGTHTAPGPLWLQIVGLEDGTTVQVRPSTDLQAGPGLVDAPADVVTEFSVGAGEYLQWESGANDVSGTIIASDQPVALFTGSRFLRLQMMSAPGGESTHQQLLPVNALGFEYAVVPYETRRMDLAPESIPYRFVGMVDGTMLDYDPDVGGPATLNAGEIVDFETTEPFVVSSQGDTHPFAIAQLMVTANLPGGTRPGATAVVGGITPQLGDEEFVLVLPPGQFLNRYAFFTDPTYATTNLVLTRVAGDAGFADVSVDCLGNVGGWEPVGTDGRFETTRVDLIRADVGVGGCENGPHLSSSTGQFGLTVWGLDTYSSYAYPAGGNAIPLSDVTIPAG